MSTGYCRPTISIIGNISRYKLKYSLLAEDIVYPFHFFKELLSGSCNIFIQSQVKVKKTLQIASAYCIKCLHGRRVLLER